MRKEMHNRNKTGLAVALAAGLIVLLAYLRALSCDFVNFDDFEYVVGNPAIRVLDGGFIASAFSASYLGWWMPLTWISFALDYHFWGLNPLGFHLTNILLHSANTALVVLVADRLCRRKLGPRLSGERYLYPGMLLLAGLLFGIHPLRVESVAWVTERKDVLNGIFSLGSILCYLSYVGKKDGDEPSAGMVRDYILALVFMGLSLMAKPVSVVLPVMLLVADWFPLGRLEKGRILPVLMEKIPFMALSAVLAVATVAQASDHAILVSFQEYPLSRRLWQAGDAVVHYLRLSLYPVDLVHLYLLPRELPVSYQINTTLALLFTCFCVYNCRRMPWLLAMWVAFLLPLLPVLGFFQNGLQSYAARFTYLPSLSLSIGCSAGGALLYRSAATSRRRLPLTLATVAVMLFYLTTTQLLIATWGNSETLWSRLIESKPVGRAYYFRARYRMEQGKYLAAVDDLSQSIRMGKDAGFPGVFQLQALRGDMLARAGRFQEAVREFSAAIEMDPRPNYYYQRGLALRSLNRLKEAEQDFARAEDETGPVSWQMAY